MQVLSWRGPEIFPNTVDEIAGWADTDYVDKRLKGYLRGAAPAGFALRRFLGGPRQCRRSLMAQVWLTVGLTALAAQSPAKTLPTLTQIGAVHRMTAREAGRGYPVRLRAVVTYFDPFPDHSQNPTVVVTDGTATIFVTTTQASPAGMRAGTVLEITGKTNPGDFAPVIVQPVFRIVSQGSLPAKAPRVTLSQLLKGTDDPAWVEMEGVVEGVEIAGNNVTMKLGLADGEIAATTVREQGVNYAGLVDALVRVRGVAGSIFNRHGQIGGEQMLFPGMATVTVEQLAPPGPFQLPIRQVSSLMTYAPAKIFNHRTHIRGAVTLFWPGRLLCLNDGSGSVCAMTSQTTPLVPGEMVDVAGFAKIGQITPVLADAVYQALPARQDVAPVAIDGSEGLSGEHDAQLVQIEGQLIAQDRALSDFTILVSAGKFTFPVSLLRSPESRLLLALEEGSVVRVTGICSVQTDPTVYFHHLGHARTKSFQIFLRSAGDVVVLQQPSWWSATHTLRVLACAFGVTLCILGWSLYLRRRLRQQTERLRFQATHDGLTGIWNRKAICDLLLRETEIAGRAGKQVGVIMLDADCFKRINDTLGHGAGDAVLVELARRMQTVVRSYDLAGRYGGEEFLIVLPGCTGEEVQDCAERVRAKVAEQPFDAGGTQLAVTVSVGTTMLDPLIHSQQDALAAADRALSQAKRSGRNCVVSAAADFLMMGQGAADEGSLFPKDHPSEAKAH